MKASSIIERAARTLVDVQNIRWTKAELVDYINDGMLAIAEANPDASSVTMRLLLAPGTLQSIPTAARPQWHDPPACTQPIQNGVRFQRVIRNLYSTNEAPGRVVRLSNIAVLDMNDPDWHEPQGPAIDGQAIELAFADPNDKYGFYVYPAVPPAATVKVSVAYAAVPEPIAEGQLGPGEPELTIGDEYIGAMTEYVCHRMLAKDSLDEGSMVRAKSHLAAFMAALTAGSTDA